MCGDAEKVLELTARTVVNAARFYSEAASRAEDSCTDEAYRSSVRMREGVVLRKMTLRVRGSFGLSRRAFDVSGGCFVVAVCSQAGSCHSSGAQHFVCIPAPLHIRPALWWWVSLRTTAPTPPPPGAQSRPFARILSKSLCKYTEDEQEKAY